MAVGQPIGTAEPLCMSRRDGQFHARGMQAELVQHAAMSNGTSGRRQHYGALILVHYDKKELATCSVTFLLT